MKLLAVTALIAAVVPAMPSVPPPAAAARTGAAPTGDCVDGTNPVNTANASARVRPGGHGRE
ncbi:MAG: hypothetical protein ACRDNL_07640, partial [Spirillospora sp.]